MPLQKLQFRPGVNREGTTLANEGGWFESDKIRFRSGYPEKIGGWEKDTGPNASTLQPPTGTLWGVCRSMWNWFNLAGYNLLSLGTNLKFYIQNGFGGTYYDATPLRGLPPGPVAAPNAFTSAYSTLNGGIDNVATSLTLVSAANFVNTGGVVLIGSEQIAYTGVSTNTLTGLTRGYNGTTAASHLTGAGVGAYTITVTDTAHGAQAGDFVTFAGAIALSTQTYTANAGTDKITFTTALPNNTTLVLFTTGAAPAGLAVGTTYYVVNSDTPTASCQLALTSGGAAINITGTGAGTQTFALTTGITASVLNAEYQVATYISSSQYTIVSTVAAGAYDTGNGGASTTTAYQITTGSDTYTTGVGWGAGGWGGVTTGYANTGWGAPASDGLGIGVQLRLWSESNFGQNLVFNARGGPLYYWVVDSSPGTFNRGQIVSPSNANTQGGTAYWQADSTCPSLVNYVLVSDASRFTIAFGCNDVSGALFGAELDPMLIRWTDQESVLTWTPDPTNQAGDYKLSHGSEIVTALQTRQEILVLTDAAIYSMQYLGPPYVWGFQIMGDNISIMGPNAAITVNNITYWMGTDKFYMYSGRVETLPCALRQYVFDDINMEQSYQFFANTNEGYNEVWWHYCSSGSTVIDKYVIFNHLERTWYYGTWNNSNNVQSGRTFWLDSPLRPFPMATTYGVAGGSTNTLLVYHENGNDDGVVNPPIPIVSYVQSSDFDIGDGHNFGLVTRIIPDVTFDGSTVNNPSLDFSVRPRQFPGTNYGDSNSPTVTSTQNYQQQRYYTVQQFTQQVFVRIRGRQMALKIESNDLGVAWQLGVPRIDTRPDGRR
jgi:hypothetical protein